MRMDADRLDDSISVSADKWNITAIQQRVRSQKTKAIREYLIDISLL
jgi:hypothetical protein